MVHRVRSSIYPGSISLILRNTIHNCHIALFVGGLKFIPKPLRNLIKNSKSRSGSISDGANTILSFFLFLGVTYQTLILLLLNMVSDNL